MKKKFKNLVRNGLIMFFRKPQLCWSVQCAYRYKISLRLNMKFQRSISKKVLKNLQHSNIRRTWSFQVLILQKSCTKRTKMQNAYAEPLFCGWNFLFGEVVGVVVVVCVSSLLFCTGRKINQQRHYNGSA